MQSTSLQPYARFAQIRETIDTVSEEDLQWAIGEEFCTIRSELYKYINATAIYVTDYARPCEELLSTFIHKCSTNRNFHAANRQKLKLLAEHIAPPYEALVEMHPFSTYWFVSSRFNPVEAIKNQISTLIYQYMENLGLPKSELRNEVYYMAKRYSHEDNWIHRFIECCELSVKGEDISNEDWMRPIAGRVTLEMIQSLNLENTKNIFSDLLGDMKPEVAAEDLERYWNPENMSFDDRKDLDIVNTKVKQLISILRKANDNPEEVARLQLEVTADIGILQSLLENQSEHNLRMIQTSMRSLIAKLK